MVSILKSRACCAACGNLKAAFLITVRSLFPFFLLDSDWMGREVYVRNLKRSLKFKLIITVSEKVVLAISSFFIEPMCKWIRSWLVWALSNFIVFVCMACTTVISLISVRDYSRGIQRVMGANQSTKVASLVVFAILGFPLSITYSVHVSVLTEMTADSGGGQGLAIGVLNLAIVIPQMVISLGAGPWAALIGGGNIPAFVLASVAALAAGVIATLKGHIYLTVPSDLRASILVD